jgi:uncharacterized protein YccT (UPF0319 family)
MNTEYQDLLVNTKNGFDWYKQADPKEQKLFREWLQGVLKTETVCLTFRKKDDTIREMKCTLVESKLPVVEKKTDRVRKENDDVISVFDLEKNEWRSCRYDSIKQINFTLGE